MSKEKQAVIGSILADSYCLGAHWIYDEKELKNLDLSWDKLNAPRAAWHQGKRTGDLTHYGDHTLWLLDFVTTHKEFDVIEYARYWLERMAKYEGYIDGSSRESLVHLEAGNSPREGVVNHDLSICGRIAPLLLISHGLDDFVSRSVTFAKMTHNDLIVLEAVHFFATLLYSVIEGATISKGINKIASNYSKTIRAWIEKGLASKDEDTFTAIRNFGPACGVDGGFASVIHLLAKYNDFETLLKANAQAGGDSSARGMIAGMLLGTNMQSFPWSDQLLCFKSLESMLSKI